MTPRIPMAKDQTKPRRDDVVTNLEKRQPDAKSTDLGQIDYVVAIKTNWYQS